MKACVEELARLQRTGQLGVTGGEETELASTLIMFTTKGQSPVRKKRNALLDKSSD